MISGFKVGSFSGTLIPLSRLLHLYTLVKFCVGVTNVSEDVTTGSWLPINDAVEILGVSRKTVYTYIKSEKLIAKKEFGKRFVWIEDSVDVSPVSTSDKITQGNNNSSVQKILIAKLKMEIELLERTLVVKEEHVDSLKQEVNRLSILLMLEKRSIFARVKDYFIGSTFHGLEVK